MTQAPVAITGIGVVSSIGTGFEAFCQSLYAPLGEPLAEGQGAGGSLTLFEEENPPPVAEAQDFLLEDHIETVKTYIDRTSAFALASCGMARKHAGWELSEEEETLSGLSLGTAWGCQDSVERCAEKFVKSGPKLVPPLVFTHSYANSPNSIISIEYSIRGFNACFAGGRASGLQAVCYAADQVRLGRSKFLLAGGADSLSRFTLRGYQSLGCLADQSQPFCSDSHGFLLSEGAGVLAMEPASDTSLPPLGHVAGIGLGRAEPGPNGCLLALQRALAESGIGPGELGLVVSPASGEPELDQMEAEALTALFEAESQPPPIIPLKALTGEPMAAGGPAAVIAAVAILQRGELPPLEAVEGSRIGDLAARQSADALDRGTALVYSLSEQGDICALVVRRP